MINDCEFNDELLDNIKKQFFSLTPAKKLPFATLFSHPDGDSVLNQNAILSLTVKCPLVKKFPVKIEYQRSFLKCLITRLETNGVEISEDLYTAYCDLLSTRTEPDETTHFRHYLLDSSEVIILKESYNVISQGTTGLCSWQASQALAEWCFLHQDIIKNKKVLELGSGVGLTGFTVCLRCEPGSYWFSDCHPAVLHLLQYNAALNINLLKTDENVDLNSDVNSEVEPNVCNVLFGGRIKNTDIKVIHLPWEEVADSNIASEVSPDIILAADVVYDDSISPDLIQALKHILVERIPSKCLVVMACTVRNPKTLDTFFTLLNNELEGLGLEVIEEEAAEPTVFSYYTESVVKIYKISLAL